MGVFMSVPSTWRPTVSAPTLLGKLVVCFKNWKEWFVTVENTQTSYIGPDGFVTDPSEAVDFSGTGLPGPPNVLSVGTVTSGPAAVTITGTSPAQVVNFTLQTGLTGPAGTPGTAFLSATATTDSAGLFNWTFPTPFSAGVVPQCWAMAQGPSPVGGVLVNIQVEGIPTNTAVSFRVTKTNQVTVALLGLTILSIPAAVGATPITVFAKAP